MKKPLLIFLKKNRIFANEIGKINALHNKSNNSSFGKIQR